MIMSLRGALPPNSKRGVNNFAERAMRWVEKFYEYTKRSFPGEEERKFIANTPASNWYKIMNKGTTLDTANAKNGVSGTRCRSTERWRCSRRRERSSFARLIRFCKLALGHVRSTWDYSDPDPPARSLCRS